MAAFETLVARIYEASADAELWPGVLHDIAGAVDAAGGVILTRRRDSWLGWRYSSAMAPGLDRYLRNGAARSGSTKRLLDFPRSAFVIESDLFTEEEYLADPMMAEWGTPADLHHGAATAIHAPTGDLVVVQFNRRIGHAQFRHTEVETLDALRPHLARAGLLAARWRLERLRAAAEALAIIGIPAAILDADGRLLAANALIEEQRAHVVFRPRDRVALVDRAADALLRRAVAEIRDPASASVRSFAARGLDGRPIVAHLVPATGRARDLFDGGFAILALTPVATPQAPDAALIRGLFDLTAAEARVACGVAEGLTPEQIAARHGTTRETVRGQLKSVFGKTGVARQSQLAALLATQGRAPIGSSDDGEQA
jgi:DNA-binding CsgD family transcriptional regulator